MSDLRHAFRRQPRVSRRFPAAQLLRRVACWVEKGCSRCLFHPPHPYTRDRAGEASWDGRTVTSGAAAARLAPSLRRPRGRHLQAPGRSATRRARAVWCRTRGSETGSCTTATLERRERDRAPQPPVRAHSRRKVLARSERALKQLKSWANTRVVNAMVCASATFPEPPTISLGRRRSSASSVTSRHHRADPGHPDPTSLR